jgi:catalase
LSLRLHLFLALNVMSVCSELAHAATEVTAPQVVESLEGTFGVHPGERRNHIKGVCAAGDFVGTSDAARLSVSQLFSGQHIPVVARFSLAGGNPNAPDTTPNARGMALEFRLQDGVRHHITMLNTPVFGAAQPATFNDMIIASKPDPATGKPDPARLRQFFATHADALAQADFLGQHAPPVSYANATFFGIHTFKFIDKQKKEHFVRWRFMPQDGDKGLSADEIKHAPHDFLEARLADRLKRGPVRWDMLVALSQPGDSEDNPTVRWPADRKEFKAGTLTITQSSPQRGGECEKINFDPLVMAEGIAPTDDPILRFRSPAYAASFGKRLSGK